MGTFESVGCNSGDEALSSPKERDEVSGVHGSWFIVHCNEQSTMNDVACFPEGYAAGATLPHTYSLDVAPPSPFVELM